MNKSYSVHAELPTTTVWVNENIFYNLTKDTDNWVKCKLFGITCLPGRVPTFEILTEQGYVFSDIPPHMIRLHETTSPLALSDLVYNNCLSEEFSLTQFKELENKFAHVFFKNKNIYLKGQYWFSLDFYKNNNWYHCLKLENGQIAFIPSHKIVFTNSPDIDSHTFPQYQKLRIEFKV
jgi:hypothetical protein